MATDAAGVEKIAALSRVAGDRKQDITLDELGRVKRIQKPDGGFSEYTYHPTFNKVSQVLTETGKTDFEYSKAGDLIHARNDHGQLIRLDYDDKNHIVRMKETDASRHTRRELIFEYNTSGQPVKIKLLGKGEINVQYDAQGEIAKVESGQGAKMALEVSRAFQTLLEMVKVD